MKIQTEAPPARRTCAACELLLPAAEDGAPLCTYCAEDIDGALRRIGARLEAARAMTHKSWMTLNLALDKLSDEERARWERMREALNAVLGRTADLETRERVRQTQAAFGRGAAPALAAVWVAYEANWWVGSDAAQRAEYAERQRVRVETWLEAGTKAKAAA